MKQLISSIFLLVALFSCQNNNSKSKEITDSTQTNSIQKEEIEEIYFDKFNTKNRK